MCEVLAADQVLAFFLSERTEVSFSDLKKFRDSVEKEDPDIIVDVSAPSIHQAVAYYPHVFHIRGARISRASNECSLFEGDYLKDEFLLDLPDGISEKIGQCLAHM